MSQKRVETDVLNPCPKCGKTFDVGGCMTFVADYLQHASNGKCPICGTLVVVQVERYIYSEEWAEENDQAKLLEFRIEDLGLSVRTTNSLAQMNVLTIGQLLEVRADDIRKAFKVPEPVIIEIAKLLAGKGLSLKS
jgi:DNA-directed RNA polymerase alpha subunit